MKPEATPPPPQNLKSLKEIKAGAKTRMDKAISDLQHNMAQVRTGRASVTLLDSVRVDYFGTPTPLSQVATLHVPDPGMITIQPWDGSMIAPIEKAIRSADLGLNPGNDGKLIRVPLPQMNEERRRELGKKIMSIAEDHRVALRNVRRDANESVKKLAKEKLISEDEDRRAHEEIQKMTDAQIAKLDVLAKAKEKELMEMK